MNSANPENKAEVDMGLACPRCGCRHLLVVYTRPKARHIQRVRQCRHCSKRLVTRERAS